MSFHRSLTVACGIAALSALAFAAQDEHQGHHPAGAASAPSAAAPSSAPMNAQMKAMQAMHEKWMAAKTPEERRALMAEHMKSMQEGMAMMDSMKGGMPRDPAARQRMMEMRMDMMQSMMQMMMDRMPESGR